MKTQTKMATRFRDVPVRKIKLKKSDKVVFFAPHSTEHKPVLSLIKTLSEELGKKGIETKGEELDDMRRRILLSATKLSAIEATDRDSDVIEILFKLEDALLRLHKLDSILLLNPEATVLEVHALDRDYKEDDKFSIVDYFYRLRDTRVLAIRDLYSEYSEPIKQGMELIENKSMKTKIKDIVRKTLGTNSHQDLAKCFRGIDMASDRYPMLLEILSENIERVAMIEIPAPSDYLMRIFYIEAFDNLVRDLKGTRQFTHFEDSYGLKESLESKSPPSEADIRGLLKLLVREKR